MDSQPLDLCPELAELPAKRGSRIFAHLYSLLLSGILASLILVALSALRPLNRQF